MQNWLINRYLGRGLRTTVPMNADFISSARHDSSHGMCLYLFSFVQTTLCVHSLADSTLQDSDIVSRSLNNAGDDSVTETSPLDYSVVSHGLVSRVGRGMLYARLRKPSQLAHSSMKGQVASAKVIINEKYSTPPSSQHRFPSTRKVCILPLFRRRSLSLRRGCCVLLHIRKPHSLLRLLLLLLECKICLPASGYWPMASPSTSQQPFCEES